MEAFVELLLAKARKALSSLELDVLFAFARTERRPRARPFAQQEGARPNKKANQANISCTHS